MVKVMKWRKRREEEEGEERRDKGKMENRNTAIVVKW